MRTGTLTGHVTGKNRQQLIDTATGEAVAYYGCPPDDIEINLANEHAITVEERSYGGLEMCAYTGFEADYTAWVHKPLSLFME